MTEALTIGELLDTPHLGLTLIAGEGGRHRRVAWTHVSELEDPAAWLDGGELLITNGPGLPHRSGKQVHYVAKLAERRAAGLAIGVRHPSLANAMLAEADRREFPVMLVKHEVPFLSISRIVAAAGQAAAQQRLATHVRIFDTLRARTSGKLTAGELFARLEAISGFRLFLTSAAGLPLLPGVPAPPQEVLEHLDRSPSATPAIPGGHAIPVAIGRRTAAYLVALDNDPDRPSGLSTARHIATVAATELSEVDRRREFERREGVEVLSDILDGRSNFTAVDAALAACGFDSVRGVQLALIRAADGNLPDEAIYHRMRDSGTACLMIRRGETLFLLAPGEIDAVETAVRDHPTLRVGVSQPRTAGSDWALARAEAMWALQHAQSEDAPSVKHFSSGSAWMHWLPPDIPALQSLVQRILGPLIEYDLERNSSMVESLRVFFERDRSNSAAAAALFVHKHTLAYRLRRIEEITGRRLLDMADSTELWLALRAQEVLSEVPPSRLPTGDRLDG